MQGWLGHVRLVCAESVLPFEGGQLEKRNGQGEKVAKRNGSFDCIPLENFDRFTLQVHLNQLAKTRSKDRVLQMRAYLRDIFAEALEQDFLTKDPARKVTVTREAAGHG